MFLVAVLSDVLCSGYQDYPNLLTLWILIYILVIVLHFNGVLGYERYYRQIDKPRNALLPSSVFNIAFRDDEVLS